MIDLYNNIIEKGGMYGIVCVVLIVILSLIIKSIKTTILSASDSNNFWLSLLKLLRWFLTFSMLLLFTLEFYKVIDNSNIAKWMLHDNQPKLATENTQTSIDASEVPKIEANTASKQYFNAFKLNNNRIQITQTEALIFTDDGVLTYIKMINIGSWAFHNWQENRYSSVPISHIQKIVITRNLGNPKLKVVYNFNNPDELFELDESFNETNFTLWVNYGLKQHNKKLVLEKIDASWIGSVVIFIISVFLLYMYFGIFKYLNNFWK